MVDSISEKKRILLTVRLTTIDKLMSINLKSYSLLLQLIERQVSGKATGPELDCLLLYGLYTLFVRIRATWLCANVRVENE